MHNATVDSSPYGKARASLGVTLAIAISWAGFALVNALEHPDTWYANLTFIPLVAVMWFCVWYARKRYVAAKIAQTVALPGWYTDPRGAARWRWWDGTAWTEVTG